MSRWIISHKGHLKNILNNKVINFGCFCDIHACTQDFSTEKNQNIDAIYYHQ